MIEPRENPTSCLKVYCVSPLWCSLLKHCQSTGTSFRRRKKMKPVLLKKHRRMPRIRASHRKASCMQDSTLLAVRTVTQCVNVMCSDPCPHLFSAHQDEAQTEPCAALHARSHHSHSGELDRRDIREHEQTDIRLL